MIRRSVWVALAMAGWLAVIAYVQWVWAPRSVDSTLLSQRQAISTVLHRLSREIGPALSTGSLESVPASLGAAAGAHPEWLSLELRSATGQVIRAGNGQIAAGSGVRRFEQAVIDGAVVTGWVSVVADTSALIDAQRTELAALTAVLLGGLALSVVLVPLAYRVGPQRKLLQLVEGVRAGLRAHHLPVPQAPPSAPEQWLQEGHGTLLGALVARERELVQLRARWTEAREALDDSEARYAEAVRGADDGLWEWDLRANKVFFSARWKSMLGFGETEVGDSIDEWKSRIHADDLPAALTALEAHLCGSHARFEHEHRLRRKDGRYIWIHARGTALRGPTGQPQRLVGLNTDITVRKRAQEILIGLAQGLAHARDDDFFRSLVRSFAKVLGVRYAFVTECVDQPATRVRQLASWKDGEFVQNGEYNLSGTPCNETIGQGRVCFYARGIAARYDCEKGYEGYLGIPIFDGGGRVIGHLACVHDQPLDEEIPVDEICSLFAVRAGLELERRAQLKAEH